MVKTFEHSAPENRRGAGTWITSDYYVHKTLTKHLSREIISRHADDTVLCCTETESVVLFATAGVLFYYKKFILYVLHNRAVFQLVRHEVGSF